MDYTSCRAQGRTLNLFQVMPVRARISSDARAVFGRPRVWGMISWCVYYVELVVDLVVLRTHDVIFIIHVWWVYIRWITCCYVYMKACKWFWKSYNIYGRVFRSGMTPHANIDLMRFCCSYLKCIWMYKCLWISLRHRNIIERCFTWII